jgi:uncharacterized damage-inducible protein DinB
MNSIQVYNFWPDVRNGLYAALDKLSDDQLGFIPHPGLWSLGETVCHIAGCEESWFRCYVTHELAGWEEADYHFKDYPTVASLKRLLKEVHERTDAWMNNIEDTELDNEILLPWGAKAPLRWIIWHVLEHEIHHRGEIFLMLGLQGMEAPDV